MITNERQYGITRRQLAELKQAIAEFGIESATEYMGSDILARAALQALQSECDVLQAQVEEYESLRSADPHCFAGSSLQELPRNLIRARIAQHLSQRELADILGLKEQQIQRYEASEYSSASLRRLMEVADALNLHVSPSDTAPGESATEDCSPNEEFSWSRFPIREMYRRNWFKGFTGSLEAALRASDVLAQEYVCPLVRRPTAALHRMQVRSGSSLDRYALLAWEARVIDLASEVNVGTSFHEASLGSSWISELAKESRRGDGPLRARDALREVGIRLVVEPHLPGTHLDGAGLLHDDMPVIGMTLRYDRIDNFWFVLFHELFHVIRHLERGRLIRVFDDLDAIGSDRIEREADSMASEALIPCAAWEAALARYVRSPESVETFAAELGISPAIVAGRIRNEAQNYAILSDLVGQGEVRKLFVEAKFGV
jgi:HTH-type transcriptional regulator / antitoxin HigA